MTNTMKWIEPIPKQSVSKTVMESIKKGIITGSIKPGEYLPSETELSERFGVGKSSVREAIKMLEALGYIEICKGNGSRVRTSVDSAIMNPLLFQLVLLNDGTQKELLEFRKTIEIAASIVAIDTVTQEDLHNLEQNIEKTRKLREVGQSTINEDYEFHQLIYESTHNQYLILIGKTIMELFYNSLEISNEQYGDRVLSDHERILEALKARDKKRIRIAIESSLKSWYNLALSSSNDANTE
ncbi:MAG: FadR family transcriptional regulator [Sphaerochaeta sp.]|nr:FadR family transcriptional regulator [Sphaerochaeta sp.]